MGGTHGGGGGAHARHAFLGLHGRGVVVTSLSRKRVLDFYGGAGALEFLARRLPEQRNSDNLASAGGLGGGHAAAWCASATATNDDTATTVAVSVSWPSPRRAGGSGYTPRTAEDAVICCCSYLHVRARDSPPYNNDLVPDFGIFSVLLLLSCDPYECDPASQFGKEVGAAFGASVKKRIRRRGCTVG